MAEHELGRPTQLQAEFMHIDFAASMVARLPEYSQDPGLPPVVCNACLESFLVNVRLLAEFAQGWGKESKDFWAKRMFPDWAPADGDLCKRLRKWWDIASKNVMHFGQVRSSEFGENDAITIQQLNQMREDVLHEYVRFRTEHDASLPEDDPAKSFAVSSYVTDAL